MDLTTGRKIAWLPQPMRDRVLAAAQGGRGEMAEEDLPLPLFPSRPPTPDLAESVGMAPSSDSGRSVGSDGGRACRSLLCPYVRFYKHLSGFMHTSLLSCAHSSTIYAH